MTQGVLRSHKDGVTTIQLSREVEHNRLDPADIAQLRSHFAEIAEGNSLALILTGSGQKTFSSGYTLSALERGEIDASFESMLNELEALPLLTICALNGSVYGGATDLALCCDIRIGIKGSRMSMPAGQIGVHFYPDGMRRYINTLGIAQAKKLFLTGLAIDAEEMLRIGFLTELVPDQDQLAARTDAYIDAVRNCEPDIVRSMKLQLNAIANGDLDAAASRHHYEASLRSPRLAENLAKRRK
jgi:enoyl-CoA hydratase/carnithine racemase